MLLMSTMSIDELGADIERKAIWIIGYDFGSGRRETNQPGSFSFLKIICGQKF